VKIIQKGKEKGGGAASKYAYYLVFKIIWGLREINIKR
jgi:hypothetical protein